MACFEKMKIIMAQNKLTLCKIQWTHSCLHNDTKNAGGKEMHGISDLAFIHTVIQTYYHFIQRTLYILKERTNGNSGTVCSRRFLSNVCHSIHNLYIISQQILQMLTTATNSFQKCKCLNCRFAVLEAFFSACYGYCLQGTWLSGKLQYSPGSLQA